MLSCHQELHFGKCILSRYVNLCPECLHVYFHVCSSHGPSSFLLFPPSLSPPSISPWARVFLQAETETRRGRPPLERMRRSQGSPASLQQRSVGIRPVLRSLETWTSSRSVLWRDRQSLEKRERSFHNQQLECFAALYNKCHFILFERDNSLLILPFSPSLSCWFSPDSCFLLDLNYMRHFPMYSGTFASTKKSHIWINSIFSHYYSMFNKLINLPL